MGLLTRARAFAVAALLAVSACTPAQPATPGPTDAAAESSAPSASIAPVATPNPCAAPLGELAHTSQLLADELVSIREPLTADAYDGWTMLGLARSTNATLQLYALNIPGLAACPDGAVLAERLETVATAARRHIGIVLAAGAAAKPAPRQAMAGLVELIPEVVEITREAKALADQYSVEFLVAAVPEGATEPLGRLAPLPRPEKPPTTAGIDPSFFGQGVRLETYRVTGSTPFEISVSMSESGPYSEWTDSRVDGQVEARVSYRFGPVTNDSGGCSLSATGSPPIVIRYTVTLPRWSKPAGASSGTVEWWNQLVLEIATHERRHIEIYRDAQRDLNDAYASSTCGNVEDRLLAVWRDSLRRQCEFDMREYGYALGLSLEDCVTQ